MSTTHHQTDPDEPLPLQGERASTAAVAEDAAAQARRAEATAVEARRAQDCAYSERKSLEAKATVLPRSPRLCRCVVATSWTKCCTGVNVL